VDAKGIAALLPQSGGDTKPVNLNGLTNNSGHHQHL
jgi:hypothetical protein